MQLSKFVLLGLAVAVAEVPATAQVFDMGGLTATLSVDAVTQSERARAASRSAFVPRQAVPRGSPAGQGYSSERLIYQPTAQLRKQAVSQYLERIGRKSPEVARTMAEQLARHDYGAIYRNQMKGSGLRDDDAIDAVTAYTLLGWQIVNGSTAEISNSRVRAVRSQLAGRLAANPALASPQGRAALGEEMKLLFVTVQAGYQSAQREGNGRQYSDGIAAMFARQGGYDLRGIRVTDHGFEG